MTEPRHLPALARVLRLSRHVTGHEYAGLALVGLTGVPTADRQEVELDVRHPLVSATMAQAGVYQQSDISTPAPFQSYAGVPIRADGGAVLGALWVGSTAPRQLDPPDVTALADLGALLEAELDRTGKAGLAAEVQRQLLPEHAPIAGGLDMAAECRPAQEVGGDFYDWWSTDDTLQVVVADVMGKGVPAAIVASAIRAMLRAALTFNTPATALRRVGGDLQSDLDQLARFATCFAVRVDLNTYELTFVDAGHGLALILRDDGTATHLSSRDLPLGVLPEATWQEQKDSLAPGETLLVVSDGVLDLFETTAACIEHAQKLHRDGARAADFVAELANDARAPEHVDDLTVVAVRRPAR